MATELADWLVELPREWVFPDLGDLRPPPRPRPATYTWWPLDRLPAIHLGDRSAIDLLLGHSADADGISGEDGEEAVDRAALDAILRADGDVRVPDTLRRFIGDPEPRRRIRSVTACFLDLGEGLVPIDGGGHLLHLVSDQQWVIHWLVALDGSSEPRPVIASTIPFGYPFAGDAPASFERATALDQSTDRTVVCAESVDEFLARLFLENEAWHAEHPGIMGARELSPDVRAYITALRAARGAG